MSRSQAEVRLTAALRRQRVQAMRKEGLTFEAIGVMLNLSYQRAQQLGRKTARRGNPQTRAEHVWFSGTIAEYLSQAMRRIDECVAAHSGLDERP